MDTEVTGGQTTWEAALAEHLAGATCLWQDLDGLHIEPAPAQPPLTTILWGWRDDALVRVRLDTDTDENTGLKEVNAFVAVVPSAAPGTRTVPWNIRPDGDGRVAGIRGPAVESGAAAGEFEQVIVVGQLGEPGTGTAGPITFVRPAARA